ncbi:iron-sulfur-binding ferredoxin reductase [Pseudomonas kuykendallii]|uniref:iron-sulfur-binding ferredoxin reductase n=1 Tax=Pseudomonas kuykendallii TaxID=1007099 RepID=UPI0028CFDFDB|nr:iron-sulfur-binding ferredoxin reductase [Pseudomonas kuykendallii]
MPRLEVRDRHWSVAAGSNLLDALNSAGVRVPYSCRAGSCHACMVRCVAGEVEDALPGALDDVRRAAGWRLSCQCRVVGDLRVEVFDPAVDAVAAQVQQVDWRPADVLRLRLQPARPLAYQPGQHVQLFAADGTSRPYSFASLPGYGALEFHLDCREPGAFSGAARTLRVGDALRIGEVRGGALHYDPDWSERPLLILASGTGLAPLWGVLREALRQGHTGPIKLVHLARDVHAHYLAQELGELAAEHPQLSVELVTAAELPRVLAGFRLVPRRTVALLCGQPARVEEFARALYLAGIPRSNLLADVFLPRA